ncbi:putative excision nuclease [Mycobacteroides abscessus subsp. bolletii 1S-154-0310]|nr:putative excision nuclease [Mycobacteroides abscessus subsp. bolletii 1S-153-0915]EIU80804.1 putative excision nuclease [Mycobacteroides abscessus subsp. bolletii 1S-154-0310]
MMDRLSLGRTAVFELLNSGELRSVKVGRRRLVSEGQIADYIARLEAKSA